ncbi:MAG TPA: class I SAM-dependent methyltransferase [Roseiflexaceae bacterium]|jgi:SAM-dependent methyltransferase|nr:class I SAM-dependent methyltransferase [Roseiflexaceae bacterium]
MHELPDVFLQQLTELERAYLDHDDPIRQSGFSGGAARWRAEREPLLDAVDNDGELLDIGCANGYLLECAVQWAAERGHRLIPYGLDQGERLIDLARQRMPHYADHFFIGNGWDWQPPRRFRYVYTLYDCVPLDYLDAYARRLLADVVAPGGRLIIGAYGSRSRGLPPFDIAAFLQAHGITVAGTSSGGTPPIAAFAWVDAEGSPA